jgi:hypothetical protein
MAQENDVVLIHLEDQPMAFARIETITADHKPGWYHVKLLLLQVPLQTVTWILRDVYIDGAAFTMGGKQMRLDPVACPPDPEGNDASESESPRKPEKTARVISLADLKKNNAPG